MYQLKGFITHEGLISNLDDQVAAVGELSNYAATFAKDVRRYFHSSQPQLDLHVFTGLTLGGASSAPAAALTEQALAVVGWVYARQASAEAASSSADLAAALQGAFTGAIDAVALGPLVAHANGQQYPASVSFSSLSYTADSSQIKVWLSDGAFRNEYDDYSITVVPPVASLTAFFAGTAALTSALRGLAPTIVATQAARAGKPETDLVALEFDYVDPLAPSSRVTTTWTLLVYGAAGNNADNQKAAIAQYLAAHSARSEAEWTAVLPGVFQVTEFYLLPRWHDYAIPNLSQTQGLYSSLLNLNAALQLASATFVGVSANYINSHLEAFANPYKGLQILSLSATSNSAANRALSQRYSDLLSVNSQSLDFSRMRASTQAFLTLLAGALVAAESLQAGSTPGAPYAKALRNNRWYVVFAHEGVQFLVAAKLTLVQL